jgi:hypothetical protein
VDYARPWRGKIDVGERERAYMWIRWSTTEETVAPEDERAVAEAFIGAARLFRQRDRFRK